MYELFFYKNNRFAESTWRAWYSFFVIITLAAEDLKLHWHLKF